MSRALQPLAPILEWQTRFPRQQTSNGSVEGSPAAGSVARSLQAFTAIPSKKNMAIWGLFTAANFFLSLPHSQPHFCLHFLSLLYNGGQTYFVC
jgi:hypothetical protein